MNIRKTIEGWITGAGTRVGYGLIRALQATYRFREAGPHPQDTLPNGYVFAIWHQNLFAGILAQTGRQHVVIVSRSRDGDPVAYLCNKLGHVAARGSSKKGTRDKGGKQASEEMIGLLKSGLPGAITVDGPSGPAFVAKPGIVNMARNAGVPIVPYYLKPAKFWQFNSWDSFKLPKPGSRIDVYFGDPITVPEGLDRDAFERMRMKVGDALRALELRANSVAASA